MAKVAKFVGWANCGGALKRNVLIRFRDHHRTILKLKVRLSPRFFYLPIGDICMPKENSDVW